MGNSFREIILTGETDGSGDATFYSDGRFTGIIRRVTTIRSGGDSGALVELFMEGNNGAPDTEVIDLSAAATDLVHNPRLPAHTSVGGAISAEYVDAIIFGQRLKGVVASGGDTLPYAFHVLIEELRPTLS